MSARNDRNLRRVAKETAATAFPAVKAAVHNAAAAVANAETNRARVDSIEDAVRGLSALAGRSFKGRLTWLLLGR